jgi:hypothetical protein
MLLLASFDQLAFTYNDDNMYKLKIEVSLLNLGKIILIDLMHNDVTSLDAREECWS